jgi:hypothetical protein
MNGSAAHKQKTDPASEIHQSDLARWREQRWQASQLA